MDHDNPQENNPMKIKLYTLALAVLASSAVLADETRTTKTKADGSSETTVTTTTSSGTLTEYVPGATFIVREVTRPVSYVYGKTVSYVTESGKTFADSSSATHIKTGAKVSVNYVMDGARRVINRIVFND
jgi:flagellar capping protein FliD